jgi:prolipoprotein diacylglyceryltransferase
LGIPFEPVLFGYHINIHLVMEYFAFFIAFRYYVYLRKGTNDSISSLNRLLIILGAVLGALFGSRIMGYLENPVIPVSEIDLLKLLNIKTIMGGLFGGLIGVEIAKKIIGEKTASGDLFTLPIIVGIFIGRIGCFLSGTQEFTYGRETNFFMGMNLGDGLHRHPLALYELAFLLILFIFLKKIRSENLENGLLFKYFMILYFSFRFFLEFLKPNTFFVLVLSSIQILCLICLLYYNKTIQNLFRYAR